MDFLINIVSKEFFGIQVAYVLIAILLLALLLIVFKSKKEKGKYQIFLYLLVLFGPTMIFHLTTRECISDGCLIQLYTLPIFVVSAVGVLIYHVLWGRK